MRTGHVGLVIGACLAEVGNDVFCLDVELIARGATVAIYDPVAMEEAKRAVATDFIDCPDALSRVRFSCSPMDALRDADALAIVTERKAFRNPDFAQLRSVLKAAIIFDGRNLFEPDGMAEIGFEYYGIGHSALVHSFQS